MTTIDRLNKYNIILASKSPRRQELLKGLGINFEIKTKDVNEIYPDSLIKEEIPVFLSKLKADAFSNELSDNTLIITADTIIWVNNTILEKPTDYNDAFSMLRTLSNNTHEVYTGVCITTINKTVVFSSCTNVSFSKLNDEEIEYYLNKYKPYDKAGSYGIQEWIGYVGIESINGSYFNVMGLPVQKLYEELKNF